MPKQTGTKIVAQNKRARHDYFVLETWEAGIELKGTEVKSIRLGQVQSEGLLWHGEGRRTVGCMACTSVPMRRAAFPTLIPHSPQAHADAQGGDPQAAGQRDAEGTGARSAERLSEGWAHEGWRSPCARAKSSTTSATTWPSATPSGTSSAPLPAGNDPPAANFNVGRIWFRRGYGRQDKRAAALNRLKNGKLKMN